MRSLQQLLLTSALVVASCEAHTKEHRESNVKSERDLIVGGERVTANEFNWFASMQNGNDYCGGALISASHVLTSAVCLNSVFENGKPSIVRLGTLNDLNVNSVFGVECVTVYPFFDNSGSYPLGDIALVKLDGETSIEPIELNDQFSYPNTGSELMLLGFGSTDPWSRDPSPSLLKATLPFIPLGICTTFFNNELTDMDHFCAGGQDDVGGCFSDGGGPLVGVNAPHMYEKYVLAGIYSFETSSCGDNTPDVFSEVSNYVFWIKEQLTLDCPITPEPSLSPTVSMEPTISPEPTATPTPEPTPSPTPFPTPSPTAAPTLFCFSEDASVEVLGYGSTPMKDLHVGQQVFSGYHESTSLFGSKRAKTAVYETVYAFGHRNEVQESQYIRITTQGPTKQPLEISGSHLIFVHGKEEPVRADSLVIGDRLLHKSLYQKDTVPATITKIELVLRKGLYQPLTKDGTILVDGLEASTYVSVEELAPRVVQFGLNLFSEQSGFHWCLAPYRFVCTKVAPQWCINDYNREQQGINHWLAFGKSVMEAGEHLPRWLMAIYVTFILSFCGLFMFLDVLLEGHSSIWLLFFGSLGVCLWSSRTRRPQKAKID